MPTHPASTRTHLVESTPGLLAFWDFQSPPGSPLDSPPGSLGSPGSPFTARGPNACQLHQTDGQIERVIDGVFGPHSIRLGNAGWLCAPAECPALNLHGPDAQVSLVAWLKRTPATTRGCQAVAGMWNEHGNGQYALFLNLHIWDSDEQAAAHLSATGGATPGYKYCMEAAIGATPVPLDSWHCVAITYDTLDARVYLDGKLDLRPGRNPCRLPGGLFDGGPNGEDFTVGAVARPERVDEQFHEHGSVVANRFHGLLGGLAVFNRALTDAQVRALSNLLHAPADS